MKKILLFFCVLIYTVPIFSQTNSAVPTKDARERCYLDLSKSVKTKVVYNGIPMYQFLTSKLILTSNKEDTTKNDTTIENILMWVEEESGEKIMTFARIMLVEGYYVEMKEGVWIESEKPTFKQNKNPKVICKIYNYGFVGNIPSNNNSSTNSNGNNLFKGKTTSVH